jgi:hypothetical protein
MDNQIKNSFDKITIQKILKGAAIAATGSLALYILQAIQNVDFGQAVINSLVAGLVPIIVNTIKEYLKGNG